MISFQISWCRYGTRAVRLPLGYTLTFLQTMSSLGFFLFAMVVNPDIQAKAQRIIDEVCPGRLPTFDDMPNLPYIDALVKETIRWRPVLPLSVYLPTLSYIH